MTTCATIMTQRPRGRHVILASAGCGGRGAGAYGEGPSAEPFAYGAAIFAPSRTDVTPIPEENSRRRWTSESRSIMCETTAAATRELHGQTLPVTNKPTPICPGRDK